MEDTHSWLQLIFLFVIEKKEYWSAETKHCIEKSIDDYDGSNSISRKDMVSCQGPGERAKSGFPPSEDRSWGGLGLRLRLASLAVRQ